MPHIITNYSSNLNDLDSLQLLKDVNTVLLDTMLFSEHDIKSRIFKDQNFLIGVNGIQDAYIHLKLCLLSAWSYSNSCFRVSKLKASTFFWADSKLLFKRPD